MQIVQGDQVDSNRASLHRTGKSFRKVLLDGKTGIDNFSFVISRAEARFSPRHRHNFEQYRYQLDGTSDYASTGVLEPGMLGYFPEGMHYGPQTAKNEGEDITVLVLQCGGASGYGYVSREDVLAGAKELQKMGEFKEGVFHRNEGLPGKRKVEGSQAIWEHIMQRPLEFPKPRYAAPILMHPDNFDWVPVENAPGVSEKMMGHFTERDTGASFLKLESAAEYTAEGARDIYFVLSGAGKAGDESYRNATTVYLDRGETIAFHADEETEMVHFRLPDLSGITAQ